MPRRPQVSQPRGFLNGCLQGGLVGQLMEECWDQARPCSTGCTRARRVQSARDRAASNGQVLSTEPPLTLSQHKTNVPPCSQQCACRRQAHLRSYLNSSDGSGSNLATPSRMMARLTAVSTTC